jgi:RND family efflux transporter MFP subunit
VAGVAVVLALSALGAWWLVRTGPRQEKREVATPAPMVDVLPLAAGARGVSIEAFGTVSPAREVALAPEVAGRVVEIHAAMEPGALVKAGDVILRIDPADYRLAVRAAEAGLAQAEADLAVERGRARVAEREWARYGATLETVPAGERAEALALREPQRKQAEARVAAARNAIEEAKLRLERTTLRAPFDAFVVEESLEVGRRVEAGAPVVTLAGVDAFHVVASMPLDRAPRLDAAAAGAPVRVVLQTGLGESVERAGRFVRRLPGLEAEGRMARALVAVDDPLGLKGGAPALPIGGYVRVDIPAGELAGVYEVPREALRENGRVWVRDGAGTLRFRDVDVVWRRAETVLLRGGFEPGDELVTTYMLDPLPGTALRRRAAAPPREGGG